MAENQTSALGPKLYANGEFVGYVRNGYITKCDNTCKWEQVSATSDACISCKSVTRERLYAY